MRGGLGLGLALLLAVACGGRKTDDFGDDPEKSGAGGEPGSSGSGVGGGSGSGGSAVAGTGTGGSGGSGGSGSGTGGVCAPGATQACFGPGQCPGAQRCTAEGNAWGDCDCGSSAGGTGGGSAGTAGAEPGSGSGGMPAQGGSGGGNNGGGSGEACETDFCAAFCDASTGHCPNDGSRDDCMTQCTETRCTTQIGCLDAGAEYFKCIADSTPACVGDVSAPGDGDCRDEGTAFFDCLVVPWHCDEDAELCICGRTRDSTAPARCEVAHECCLASINGGACGCDDTELCDDIGPGFIKVDHCPLE